MKLPPPEPLARTARRALLNLAALDSKRLRSVPTAPGCTATGVRPLAADPLRRAVRQLQSRANEALLKVRNGVVEDHIVLTDPDVRQVTGLSQSFQFFQELDRLFNLKAGKCEVDPIALADADFPLEVLFG